MIDIHTHIIPFLDDGPADMETSIGMGHIAVGEGLEAIISTSHSKEASEVGREEMELRLQAVRDAWRDTGIGVKLELGVEIYLGPTTLRDLQSGKLWGLAGSRYVLVELPYNPWPTYADDTLFELQLAGYRPILAHPERYVPIQRDPNKMYELAERGVMSQVTGAALLGSHGHAAQKCTETLVRHGLAQFISSDAHGMTVRKRSPQLREAVTHAKTLVGEEKAWALVKDNPACILSDTVFELAPERVSERKGFLGGIFGRD